MLNVNFHCRFGDVTDGVSNTILLGELAGRPDVYRAGALSTLNVAAGESTAGAGWGDPLNGESWFNGSLYDGTGAQGPCPINCTNLTTRGLYAFHTGGANVAMGDGSVRFLAASIDPATFAYLVTRDGGEVINGNF
jgi:prepilin-type processing-associated H-X9-DG protein